MANTFRISALQALGYTEREATFLSVAALQSGYFLRRQYHDFAGVESGKAALLLEKKLMENGHARVLTYAFGTQVYHLGSRPFFRAIGEENNRNRRSRPPVSIKAKLMGLDYVLAGPKPRWLATETEKLDCFVRALGLSESQLPGRTFRSKSTRDTNRHYFVEKYPIGLDTASDRSSPVVSFAYVDEGVLSTAGFESFLKRYEELFRALGRFRLVYVAASLWHFRAAIRKFRRFEASLQVPVGLRLSRELAEYFRLRKTVDDERYAKLDTDDLDRLRTYMKRFKGASYEEKYRVWNATPGSERPAKRSVVKASFETCLLPHNYDIFGSEGPISPDKNRLAEPSSREVSGETLAAKGFHQDHV